MPGGLLEQIPCYEKRIMSKGKFAKKLYNLIYTVKIRLSAGFFLLVLNFLTERFIKGNGEGEGAN